MLLKSDRLKRLSALTGETDENILLHYYELAEAIILDRLYPYKREQKVLPQKYFLKCIQVAEYLYNKRGAEGQTAHGENGISRSYESASVPESMLDGIVPFASVFGSSSSEKGCGC